MRTRLWVPPNEIARTPLDLVRLFRIRESGSYYAIVDLSFGGKRYVSPKLFFEVVNGVEVKRLTSFTPPRLFSLRLINRGEGDEILLRVQSSDERLCYGVYPLGFTMKSFPARMMMDSRDVVHVLHRASPKEFSHFQFSTAGIPVDHKVLESRLAKGPDLVKGGDGGVVVQGAIGRDLAELSTITQQPDLADLPEEELGDETAAVVESTESVVEESVGEDLQQVPVPSYLAPVSP